MTGYQHVKNPQWLDANKTYLWLGEDNEQNFQRHCADPEKHALLLRSGWLDDSVVYNFNSQGFRSPEFGSETELICVFGCSMTFGVGIKQEQRYGDILAKDLNLHCYNFGISGGSDSTSVRLALTWLRDLRPKIVIYQKTFPERWELIQDGWSKILGINAALGGTVPLGQGDLYKTWMVNSENHDLLAEKNCLTMRSICSEIGSRLIEITHEDFFGPYDTKARDTHHPGPRANEVVAAEIKARL